MQRELERPTRWGICWVAQSHCPEAAPQSLPAGTFTYQTNALDERIKKTAQGTTTDFVWASPGQLLAEKSGTQRSDHIWLNGELQSFK